ncbi:transposase [candidate division WOR-3 bacterium]|nr:transposase [candidate division WOR-3 bacterium]
MVKPNEEQIRKEALKLYLDGKSVSDVCRKISRSREWFYKWLRRYQGGASEWYQDRSRAPRRVANKTPEKVEEQVLKIRSRLENSKYSQIGAMAIQWEMEKLGIETLPSWTINRILRRHNVVHEKKKYKPSGKKYPEVKEIFSDSIQQADIVGPRYIKNDGRFYSLNVIDLESYLTSIYPCRTKGDEDMSRGLLYAWKNIGKPDFIQFDNELSFRGSNRYPRSLGLVIRMCLSLGVQVIFIPVGEPWRNGVIEKFQDVFDKIFYRKQFFTSFKHLKQEALFFEKFRNRNHRCSALHGRTPLQYIASEDIYIRKLDGNVVLKKIDLSLEDGYIHIIRFIRSDCQLNVYGEKFKMPKRVMYEYVIATICTKTHTLQVRIDKELIETYEYPIPIEYERW